MCINSRQIYHLLLCHILWTYFIVQMLYSFMRYFQCFSSSFPVFIIISICAHSHDSVKHWWQSSQSINGCMLTSTKIWYLESFCSSYEIDVSVIWHVICCSYRLYFYLKIITVIFYVVSCEMLLCLQHILNWSCWILNIYYMCMLCESIVIYQCTCVFVLDYGILYCNILYLYDISYFLMCQYSSIMCYCVEYWYHIWYVSF